MKTMRKLIAIFVLLAIAMTAVFADVLPEAKIITENGIATEYPDFTDAVHDWSNGYGSTLILLKDVTFNNLITITRNFEENIKNYTLDLNNHGIMFTGDDDLLYFEILQGNSLTITDSATTKTDRYITLNSEGRGVSVSESGIESSTCVKVTGGYITGAKGSFRATVSLFYDDVELIMNAGTIVGNNGGIVIIGGTATIAGDSKIIRNTVNNSIDGGGIYFFDGSLKVADDVQITDNRNSEGLINNIYIHSGQKIEFSGQLGGNAHIGVNGSGVITNGLNCNTNNAKGSTSNFISDDSAYTVVLNSDGEAFLASLVTITANVDPSHAGVYYATYYNTAKSYVADANTEVYYASANVNGKLTLVKVNDKLIKAGEGVILKSTSATVTLTETSETASYDSLLTGSDTATTVTNALVLSNGENGVHFYKYSGSVAAHKAYISE